MFHICEERFCLKSGQVNLQGAGTELSKQGLKDLEVQGATLQTSRSRNCDASGPRDNRAEDVQEILDNGSWEYDLNDDT